MKACVLSGRNRRKAVSHTRLRTVTGDGVRSGAIAPLYALTTGLMVAATQGAWWVAGYACVVGPCVGWRRVRRTA
jgi:hypothetical protein